MSSPREKKTWAIALAGVVGGSVILSLLALLVISVTHEDIPGFVVEAQKARDSQDLKGERAALESLREADPHRIESLEELARISRKEGRLVDAANLWGEVAALDPLHASAHLEQARNLYAAGDYRSVLEILSLDLLQNDPDAQTLHAMTLLGTGRTQEAEALIARVMAAHPEHAAARLLHADQLLLDDQLDAAEVAYSQLLDEAATAAGDLT